MSSNLQYCCLAILTGFFVSHSPPPPLGVCMSLSFQSHCFEFSIEVFWYRSFVQCLDIFGTRWFGNSCFFQFKDIFSDLLVGEKAWLSLFQEPCWGRGLGHRISVQHVGCQTSPQFLVWYLIAILLWTLVCSLLGIYLNISVKICLSPESAWCHLCRLNCLQIVLPVAWYIGVVLWLLGNRLFLTLCKLSPLLIPLVISPGFCGSCRPPRLWELPLWLSRFCKVSCCWYVHV